MEVALKMPLWKKGATSYYTDFSQLRKLLLNYGLSGSRRVTTDVWDKVPQVGIAAINKRVGTNGKEYWHWVIFQRHNEQLTILDPRSKAEVRTDLKRMKLFAYMRIDDDQQS